jgi:hypothetical protein
MAKKRRAEAKQMRLPIWCDMDMPRAFWNHARIAGITKSNRKNPG